MKITIAKSAGFCFGVQRAIDISLKTARNNAAIEMLGDIVHNKKVVENIKDKGIKKIRQLKGGKNKILLIRAHGASTRTLSKATGRGYKIVDATCPMVKEIHKIAKDAEQAGYSIIIIGDKKHDEVTGILGQLRKKALVIDTTNDIPLDKIKKLKKIAVVVQSTQNLEKVNKLAEELKKHSKDMVFYNTICKPTRNKQQEIREMPLNHDVMIIIGSKTSANTKRLHQISSGINKRSYWIESKEEIDKKWFKNADSVGITAGASTPDSTIREVVTYVKNITKHQRQRDSR